MVWVGVRIPIFAIGLPMVEYPIRITFELISEPRWLEFTSIFEVLWLVLSILACVEIIRFAVEPSGLVPIGFELSKLASIEFGLLGLMSFISKSLPVVYGLCSPVLGLL